MAKRSDIGLSASKATRKAFAEKFSSYTSFTAEEIKKLFPKKADRKKLEALIEIVNSDKEEKEKRAELVKKIGQVSGAVIKLTKKAITGL